MGISNKYLIAATAFLLVGELMGMRRDRPDEDDDGATALAVALEANSTLANIDLGGLWQELRPAQRPRLTPWNVLYSGSFIGDNIIFNSNPSVAEIDRAFDENPTINAVTISSGTISNTNRERFREIISSGRVQRIHMDFNSSANAEQIDRWRGFLGRITMSPRTRVSASINNFDVGEAFLSFIRRNEENIEAIQITYSLTDETSSPEQLATARELEERIMLTVENVNNRHRKSQRIHD